VCGEGGSGRVEREGEGEEEGKRWCFRLAEVPQLRPNIDINNASMCGEKAHVQPPHQPEPENRQAWCTGRVAPKVEGDESPLKKDSHRDAVSCCVLASESTCCPQRARHLRVSEGGVNRRRAWRGLGLCVVLC
jgi:hypothetical protein